MIRKRRRGYLYGVVDGVAVELSLGDLNNAQEERCNSNAADGHNVYNKAHRRMFYSGHGGVVSLAVSVKENSIYCTYLNKRVLS